MDGSTDTPRPSPVSSSRRVLVLTAYYLLALVLIAAFLLRESFSVPSFIYQNF